MNGLSLVANGELFAVDVTTVEKVVRNMAWTRVPAASDAVAGIANHKGGIVTLLSLSELMGHGSSEQAVNAVIFKHFKNENGQMGLLVDSPGDLIDITESDVIPQGLSAAGTESSIISGLAEIEGKLYRIIDIFSIIDRFKDSGKKSANKESKGGLENYEED